MLDPKQIFLLLSIIFLTTAEEMSNNIPSIVKPDEPIYGIQAIPEEDSKIGISTDSQQKKENSSEDESNRYTYSCLGCPLDLNVDAQGVSTLTDTALKHVESDTGEKHVLIKVHRLQQQVVAGIKYILLVEVAPTVCPKNTDLSSCPIDHNKDSLFCKIEYIEKPWINLSKTIIKNNCTVSQEFVPSEGVSVSENGGNRHITDDFMADLESQIIPEGNFAKPVKKAPNFLIHQEAGSVNDIPEFVPPKMYANNDLRPTINEDIIKEGVQTIMAEDGPQTAYSDLDDEQQLVRERRSPKSDGVGIEENEIETSANKWSLKNGDALSEREEKFLEEILLRLIAQKGWENSNMKILKVVKVEVSGVYYQIVLKVDRMRIPLITQRCTILIHTNVELSNSAVTKLSCKMIRTKRSIMGIVGGLTSQPIDNPELKMFLNDGLLHLDSQSSHTNRYKIQEVLKASSQVVSGILWRVKAKVVLSDCEKSHNGTIEECGELQGSPSRICNFKIWDQPWLPQGRQTNITCENESRVYSFRTRRDLQAVSKTKRNRISGGITDQPTDDPRLKTFLNDGLLHLDSQSSHTYRYKIQEILKASSQVVSGSLWRVKAKLILSDCKKSHDGAVEECGELEGSPSRICDFKIWDQPWLPQGRLTNITCENEDKVYSFRAKRDLRDSESDDFKSKEIVEELFAFYTKNFNKRYMNRLEYNFRLMVFKDNLKTMELLNKHEQGSATYGLTRFADLTREEFSRMNGLRPDLRNEENEVPFSSAIIPNVKLPAEFDWRQKNAVTKVKDQGSCGSCWAFSVTGNVEGQAAIKYGKLQEFSEQELVDCDKLDEGCNGGLMDNAYRTLEKMGGLEAENDYPYDAEDEKCHFDKSKVRVQLSGAVNISQDETEMAKWLVKNGPISIAINANAMQFYVGGVSHPWKVLCNPKSLDHGVLIVGYGVHTYPKFNKTLPYWIVKNSWGESWGEQGYYRVYRGDGTCGLNQTPSSAIVA